MAPHRAAPRVSPLRLAVVVLLLLVLICGRPCGWASGRCRAPRWAAPVSHRPARQSAITRRLTRPSMWMGAARARRRQRPDRRAHAHAHATTEDRNKLLCHHVYGSVFFRSVLELSCSLILCVNKLSCVQLIRFTYLLYENPSVNKFLCNSINYYYISFFHVFAFVLPCNPT
jgi:hypothetical protein